jgi:hypothetical protein
VTADELITYREDAAGERVGLSANDLGAWTGPGARCQHRWHDLRRIRCGGGRDRCYERDHFRGRVLVDVSITEQPLSWLLALLRVGASIVLVTKRRPGHHRIGEHHSRVAMIVT